MSAEAKRPLDVRLTNAVADAIKGLEPDEAEAVIRVIERLDSAEGEPADLPGAPPGTQYLAITPENPKAPVVIYRPMLSNEEGDWLVTSLIPRDNYHAWRGATERLGPSLARFWTSPGKD
jgi:hypothetical protein